MADNVAFQSATLATPTAGVSVATDDVGGVQYQRVKLDVGGDGASVPVVGTIPLGTIQALGSVQTVGTSQALGTFQPLAGSVHIANTMPGTIQLLGTVQAFGTTATKELRSTVPTTTSVAATVGNITLLGVTSGRLGAAFYVDGGAAMFLKLGSSAGTLDYTLQVQPGGYYELPFGYVGTVSAIWQTAGGSVRITEVV